MKKGNKKILAIVLVIAVTLTVILMFYKPKTESTNPNDGFLSVRLFDKWGNEYDSSGNVVNRAYSVVEGMSGITAMAFNVKVTNTGAVDLSCNIGNTWVNKIQTGEPYTSFNGNFTKTAQTVPSGGYRVWQGGIMAISPATEALTDPTNYTVEVTCTYGSGADIETQIKRGSLYITITAESGFQGVWDIELNKTMNPTEFCGNGVCDAGESCTTCPQDPCNGGSSCIMTNGVEFRAYDITYPSGSAVAWKNNSLTCGAVNSLTQYGYVSSSTTSSYNCTNTGNGMPTKGANCGGGTPTLLGTIPGSISGYVGTLTLWGNINNLGNICVCDDQGNTNGGFKYIYYSPSDSDRTKVDSTPTTVNAGAEVAC